jgi:hypothetical protein
MIRRPKTSIFLVGRLSTSMGQLTRDSLLKKGLYHTLCIITYEQIPGVIKAGKDLHPAIAATILLPYVSQHHLKYNNRITDM